MMDKPRALILTGYGINCDYETQFAFIAAGAAADRGHVGDLIGGQVKLADYQILAVPGGFSFGDDLGSGKVLAAKLKHHLGNDLKQFVADGKLVIGICNGFQVLTNLGLLPGLNDEFKPAVALTTNENGRFEDRWVHLRVTDSACVFTKGLKQLYLPVRHGEGRFVVGSGKTLAALKTNRQIALRYTGPDGKLDGANAGYPWDPNGSTEHIAGICDPTGRVFGLMPHPEAYNHPTNHPRWSRQALTEPEAQRIFQNAVEYVTQKFGSTIKT